MSTTNIHGDKWYEYFKGLHNQIADTNEFNHIGKQNMVLKEDLRQKEHDKPFTRKEFDSIFNKMKNKREDGSDSISNEMIKNSPEIIVDLLLTFVNLFLTNHGART